MKDYQRIFVEKEGDLYVAYFPLLGISHSGKTKKKAKKRLIDAIGLFSVTFLENNPLDVFIKHLRS